MSKKGGFKFSLYWLYSIIAIALISLYYMNDESVSKEVSWTKFSEIAINDGKDIKEIKVYRNSNELEALITDSLAAKILNKDVDKVGKNPKLLVSIPSSDQFDKVSSEWR